MTQLVLIDFLSPTLPIFNDNHLIKQEKYLMKKLQEKFITQQVYDLDFLRNVSFHTECEICLLYIRIMKQKDFLGSATCVISDEKFTVGTEHELDLPLHATTTGSIVIRFTILRK